MKYRVLSGASASSLEEQVEDLLKEGWKLQGGVSTDTMIAGVQPSALRGGGNINITQTLFSQAMTLDPVDEVVPESVKEAPTERDYETVHLLECDNDSTIDIMHAYCDTENDNCKFIKWLKNDSTLPLKKNHAYTIEEKIGGRGKYVITSEKPLKKGRK